MKPPAIDSAVVARRDFCAKRLEQVFARCFAKSHRTVLRGGYAEPLYQPAQGPQRPAVIRYRGDFFASALHEVAHWCIAGEQRRRRVDYGYWYTPEGRDCSAQAAFEAVEFQPQALEWIFARACGYPFRISLDNLDGHNGQIPENRRFNERVLDRVEHWQGTGLAERPAHFFTALSNEFKGAPAGVSALKSLAFSLEELS